MSTETVPQSDAVVVNAAAVAQDTTDITQIIEEEVLDIEGHRIKLLFVRLYTTFLIWVGDSLAPSLENISLAIGKSMTTMSERKGDLIVDSNMASSLSLKYNEGRPVYVAYNYPPMVNNWELRGEVEKRLTAFVARCLKK